MQLKVFNSGNLYQGHWQYGRNINFGNRCFVVGMIACSNVISYLK